MSKQRGFSIPEILTIITLIGVIVTIGIFTWSGTQIWSQNKARENELQQWASSFELYKSRFSYYPGMPDLAAANGTNVGYYCLGTFTTTANKCGEYTSGTTTRFRAASGPSDPNGVIAETIRTELAKVGNTPANAAPSIDNLYIGPYVAFDKTATTITAKFIGIFKATACPSGTTIEASPPMVGSISGIISCKISKTLPY